MSTVAVVPCRCGSTDLRVVHERIAEDAMSSAIDCRACGARGEGTDDAWSDPHGAAALWNRGRRSSADGQDGRETTS